MGVRARILCVDDEEDNRRGYASLLGKSGYTVRLASSGNEAFSLALESPPDLVLSDVSMPDGDGLSLLTRLRSDKRTTRLPVILMSAVRMELDDQSAGLERGADDYLKKPVDPRLLRAKIIAVLRRYSSVGDLSDVLKTQGLTLDVTARTAVIPGKKVSLTRKEFDLLTMFLRKPGRVLSIPFLLETVWGYDPADYIDPHTVGVHLSSLRKKIGVRLAERIVSLPSLGYRFDP